MIREALSLLLGMAATGAGAAEEDYSFDTAEFEKKPYEIGGYLEQKIEALRLDTGSSAYRLSYPGEVPHSWLTRSTTTLELSGRASFGSLSADARGQGYFQGDDLTHAGEFGRLKEGGLRWSASPGFTLDLGKRVQRWGKGYAWNPVGLIERPKDPTDPTASREGFTMLSAEWTQSLEGPVSTLSLTTAVVPTRYGFNADFGQTDALNAATRFYLLAWNTDVDLVWRNKGARAQSYGLDFSRNLTPALEVHGEWARSINARRTAVSADGTTATRQGNADSYLLGMRYLSSAEVTWFAEYYRNGTGYSANQLDDYYAFADRASGQATTSAMFTKAQTLSQSGYAKSNPGRDYAYLKASLNEPFGWLYSAISLTTMNNLNDGSWQVQPEVSYTGLQNIEIRSRAIFFGGARHADFTEKLSSWRFEIYLRKYF